MKIRILIILLTVCLLPAAMPARAEIQPPVAVKLNGEELQFEQTPLIENGSVLVPMRGILEALGASVGWVPESKTVEARLGNITLAYTIGEKTAYKNGLPLELGTPGLISNGFTLVPVRFFAEALGAKVSWDQDMRTASIVTVARRNVQIEQIMDGMYVTVRYIDGTEKDARDTVRLAGISPVHNGQEPTAYIRSQVREGSILSMDILGNRDRNRHIHGILYLENGLSLNEKLLAEGIAAVSDDLRDGLKEEYGPLMLEAKTNLTGFWNAEKKDQASSIRSMDVASSGAAVVMENGELWTWGQFYEKPTRILEEVVMANVDTDSGIALKRDGTVWVWGFNNGGLWGTGESGYEVTVVPRQVAGLREIVSVELAHAAAFAIDGSRQVFAWGSNFKGKLGQEYSLANHLIKSPYATGWTDVQAVSPGFEFSVVLKKDGTVWKTQPGSSSLLQLDGLRDIVSVSNRNSFALALQKDGTVWTWGVQSVFGPSLYLEPGRLEGLEDIVRVSAGDDHALAMDRDGSLYAWGSNLHGQLGNAQLESAFGKAVKVPNIPPVKMAATGVRQSLLLLQDGTLWGVGGNTHFWIGPDFLRDRDSSNVIYQNKLTRIELKLSEL
ncbi:stalk domain-containing protein [Paenibacillus sp. YN15]|uniref:stalk domain-containing protein n=1 Tax=Paenibacillus sp. YN15 TaxID=1742774 RepID=UPI000DCDD1B4|nr:stalk domain-containing protein [Paenibacillus sp. YN15]RAU96139.1 hypothetical protein DQG13_20950 [Paenibacillus sp. YN15]